MPRKLLNGVVIKKSSNKTVIVRVERKYRHSLYKKTITTFKNYAAHDNLSLCNLNDYISIEESRPISKTKKWVVKNV
jgi:small subunit ribosomal protein S17